MLDQTARPSFFQLVNSCNDEYFISPLISGFAFTAVYEKDNVHRIRHHIKEKLAVLLMHVTKSVGGSFNNKDWVRESRNGNLLK
jgi:hypothetical protein